MDEPINLASHIYAIGHVYTKHTEENSVIDMKSFSKLPCAVTQYAYFLVGAGSDWRIVKAFEYQLVLLLNFHCSTARHKLNKSNRGIFN